MNDEPTEPKSTRRKRLRMVVDRNLESGREETEQKQGQTAETRAVRAIRNRRLCHNCAFPIRDELVETCPYCGSNDIDERGARPVYTEKDEVEALPHPWSGLDIPPGGTVLLSGDAGSGKTSICIAAKPTLFLASEQEVRQIGKIWYRIHGKNAQAPLIKGCYSWAQVEEDIIGIDEECILVIDSVSQLGDEEDIVKRVIEKVRDARAIAFFIVQFRKDGVMLGPNILRHMTDVVVTIPNNKAGMRQIIIEKNRYGNQVSRYFRLDENGVGKEDFPYAYTVEGPVGNYELHMYPMSGGKLTGIFDALVDRATRIEGLASAALQCSGYESGFAVPGDWKRRKEFAEDHDLQWVSPEDARRLIDAGGKR